MKQILIELFKDMKPWQKYTLCLAGIGSTTYLIANGVKIKFDKKQGFEIGKIKF